MSGIPEIPLFQKGGFQYPLSKSIKKALLSFDLEALDRPLKKGGWEGFLRKPSQMAKQLQDLENP